MVEMTVGYRPWQQEKHVMQGYILTSGLNSGELWAPTRAGGERGGGCLTFCVLCTPLRENIGEVWVK